MMFNKKIIAGIAVGGALIGGGIMLSKKFAINLADLVADNVVDRLFCRGDKDDEAEAVKDLDFDDII